ncbi:MAG: class II glutamine amidotransferase [Spirochaetes bacterium]|nr:class II glutamine amidotransferase [Spirochaetota bacterium]
MCELLGLAFSEPIMPTLSFRGFRHRGKDNRDGWGLAYYPDESVQVIKEPLPAFKSKLSEFLQYYSKIKSKIIIAHVRYTSGTSITYKNTHPFQRELFGKEYVFAHNGTLKGYTSFNTGRFTPVGETDSEYAFCRILHSIEGENIKQWTSESFNRLHDILKAINNSGSFNCLISDGEYLFCYRDKNGYNGLCFVQRSAPFGKVRLCDEDYEINLAEEKSKTQKGFIVATKPLTDETWNSFAPAELIVFKNGVMVFSSTGRDANSLSISFDENEMEILRVLRRSPHRVALKTICENIEIPREKIILSIRSLLNKGYIKQDRRDKVGGDHDDATFYTESSKRLEIDRLIKK